MTESDLPDLPIIEGKTLRPKRLGSKAYYELLPQLVASLPNLALLLERRLERGPVPVPFVYDEDVLDVPDR